MEIKFKSQKNHRNERSVFYNQIKFGLFRDFGQKNDPTKSILTPYIKIGCV